MNKKRILSSLVIASLLLTGCDIIDNRIVIFLDYDNGQAIKKLNIEPGFAVADLEIPLKENSTFDKWYKDVNLVEEYPTMYIYNPIRLYAGYQLNQASVDEKIEEETLSSVITIEVHNQVLLETTKYISQGSGVIFLKEEGYYYALTNHHVTVAPKDHNVTQTFYVYDSDQNIPYLAERVHQLSDYDLAIVKFYSPENYHVPTLEKAAVFSNRDAIAIGTPQGAYNTVTYGKTRGNASVAPGDTYLSNVTFPVLVHSAPIDHGSSGGPLFDYKLDVIGINFASGSPDSEGPMSVAIPVEKIYEYFELAGGIFSDNSSL